MDSTRVPPQPRGRPFTSRMMQSNLRPVVLFSLWNSVPMMLGWLILIRQSLPLPRFGLFYGRAVSCFRLESDAHVDEVPHLKDAALAIGVLFSVSTAIQLCGVYAASARRIGPMRLYLLGSILSILIVVGGGLARIVIHFTQKKALINVCDNENAQVTIFYSWGVWGPVTSTTLDQADATDWCNSAWSRNAWSSIITLLVQLCIAAFYFFLSLGYYRQLLDPSSRANFGRPQNQLPLGTYPQQQYPSFPPPPGPPPGLYRDGQGKDQQFAPPYDSAKLPSYDAIGPIPDDTKDGEGGDDDLFEDRNNAGMSNSGRVGR